MNETEITLHSLTYTLDADYTCEQREDGSYWHTWTYKKPVDIHYTGTLTLTEAGKQWIAPYFNTACTATICYAPPKKRRRRTWRFDRIYHAWRAGIQAKKRKRRQCRAVFRRRKRGLA